MFCFCPPEKMPHPSTIARREMKINDPERYERLREEGRRRDRARYAETKRKIEAGEFSQEELAVLEQNKQRHK